jgi:hypothetical protein
LNNIKALFYLWRKKRNNFTKWWIKGIVFEWRIVGYFLEILDEKAIKKYLCKCKFSTLSPFTIEYMLYKVSVNFSFGEVFELDMTIQTLFKIDLCSFFRKSIYIELSG